MNTHIKNALLGATMGIVASTALFLPSALSAHTACTGEVVKEDAKYIWTYSKCTWGDEGISKRLKQDPNKDQKPKEAPTAASSVPSAPNLPETPSEPPVSDPETPTIPEDDEPTTPDTDKPKKPKGNCGNQEGSGTGNGGGNTCI